jgi:DNA-binding FadR family transcriptional regulator
MSDRPGPVSTFGDIAALREGVVKRGYREQVSDKLRAMIASGTLQVGDVLPGERELATALDVSRETVRGAIQILAGQGILEVSHGARTRVAKSDVGPVAIGFGLGQAINRYDIDSVHGARLVIERRVVEEAAERIDTETLARLDENLEAQRGTLDDPLRFLILDREFHLSIYRAALNPLLADITIDLYGYVLENRRRAVSQPGAIARSLQDHVAIVAALRAHDAAAVVAAFDHHLNRIYLTTRMQLDKGAAGPSGDDGKTVPTGTVAE